ncbi:Zn-dependent exopeptidase M28 [Baekduia soli]|uniref:Zn-dependent exopeptidase M28 n=1 Tax=Baekduia soli TaxID=496014 RepID=A0A5B8U521_9ACTN|nr:M28 family peptidase [Baekduia soli]QEC48173.1 Zn-dependent exopeptidase M28 [Baekduia soli]
MIADIAALAGMARGSASPGEAGAARWVADRLRERGVTDLHVRTFRGQGTYAWAHAAHVAVALLGGPAAPAALASLELDASGRAPWLRRVLPGRPGTTLVAAAGDPGAPATVALVAHLDTARTGLAWHPRLTGPGAARRLRTRAVPPYLAPVAAGALLAALPGRRPRRLGRALLAVALAAELDIARSPHVPGANDNATGVAAAMALLVDPPPGVRLVGVFCGCEESGMAGMRDWLAAEGRALAPDLVLGLDTLGCGTPIVLRAEATLLPHRYRAADLALADAGAARAGLPAPQRWRIGGWTDAVLARFAGLPAISLLSIGPQGAFTRYHRSDDVPAGVDLGCVEACLRLARGIVEEAALSAR